MANSSKLCRKFMRKRILITMLMLIIVVVFSGCDGVKKDKKIGDSSLKYVKDATIIVKGDKLIKQSKVPPQEDLIDWYMDPYCPSCTKLDEIMQPKIKDVSSKLPIRYHIMGFLSSKTIDDYSNRGAAFILSVAETSPDLAVKYLHSIMNDKFKPENGKGIKTPDDKFKEQFLKIGGTSSQWSKVMEIQPVILEMVKEQTALAFNDEKLLSKSEDGRLTVPFIIIGDSDKALNFLDTLDAETFVIDNVNKYIKERQEKPKQDKTITTEN